MLASVESCHAYAYDVAVEMPMTAARKFYISFWCQEYAIQTTVPPDFNFEENYQPTKSVYKINGHDGKS